MKDDDKVEIEDLINPDDFKGVETKVTVSNSTTGTQVPKNKSPQLIELADQGLILQLPKHSCAQGHNLVVELEIEGHGKHIKFITTARVESIEKVDEETTRVEVINMQYDDATWVKIKELFEDRQNEILDFFKAAKGY